MIQIMSTLWSHAFSDAQQVRPATGAPLFHRWDVVQSMYFVRSGVVELTRVLPDGTDLTVHTARAGDVVAEASVFSDCYHCDAHCGDATVLAVMPKAEMLRHLMKRDLSLHALRRASQEVQELRMRIEIMRLRGIGDRVDAYLTLFDPPDKGGWVRVADWIGVTPPALYRELARRRRALSDDV